MFFVILFMLCLVVATIWDLKEKSIPLWLILICGGIAAVNGTVGVMDSVTSISEIIYSLLPGALLITAAFLSRGSIGYADGLLALFLGPVFGFDRMVAGICLAFLLSAFFSLLLVLFRHVQKEYTFPFVPFLTSAMGVVVLFG